MALGQPQLPIVLLHLLVLLKLQQNVQTIHAESLQRIVLLQDYVQLKLLICVLLVLVLQILGIQNAHLPLLLAHLTSQSLVLPMEAVFVQRI
jgi:hypothetical protein